MLSRARIKFIKSLQLKKYRKEEQCFVVEGTKGIHELITSGYETVLVAGTPEFLEAMPRVPAGVEVIGTTQAVLNSIGKFQSNDAGLAVAKMKANERLAVEPAEFVLALDTIRDPGNLGTIIRIADWFAVRKIIASQDTTDFYNGKVIQASMGSFTRVSIYYCSLKAFLQSVTLPVFVTASDGANVHEMAFGDSGVIVIGNESRGVSTEASPLVTKKIGIPRYGKAESLNAAMATGIVLDNMRRSQKKP